MLTYEPRVQGTVSGGDARPGQRLKQRRPARGEVASQRRIASQTHQRFREGVRVTDGHKKHVRTVVQCQGAGHGGSSGPT